MARPSLQMAAILSLIARANESRPKRSEMTPRQARAHMAAAFEAFWNADRPVLWTVYNEVIAGPGGPVRVRLYDPGVALPAPCLVYLHGGGWVIGSLDTHDGLCRQIAQESGMLVLSVDYRLAPEHPFPAGLEDCIAAFRFARDQGADWGIDGARLAIGGDSAGANLALAACLSLRNLREALPACAVLAYGAYTPETDSPSHAAYGDGSYVLSTEDCVWFWNHYLGDADRRDPLATPLHADLNGLPPLLVTAAELDPIADDSRRLVERLREAGQPHRFVLWPGVTHACLHMTRMLDAAHRHIADIAAYLREHLAP